MLWDAATGERVATFEHEGPVFDVEISPDGKLVLTVSRVARTGRRIARLFDATSGAPIRTFDQIGITTAIFAPDGTYVVTTSTDDTARVWDLRAEGERAILRHLDGNVVSASFSTDGTRLVTATEGSSALVWHTDTWVKEVGVVGALNPATGASFDPDTKFVVVASRDRNAHIYHADNGLRLAILSGHQDGLTTAAFSPTGTALVTASEDGSARIWDPGTEDLLQVVGTHGEGAVRRVSVSPSGRLAVSAGADGTARIFDVVRRRQLEVLRHGKPVTDASFSPDGRLVLTASEDGSVRLWRPGGELVRTLPHGGRVLRAVFSPDGSLVATAGDDRLVRVWRTRDGGCSGCSAGTPAPCSMSRSAATARSWPRPETTPTGRRGSGASTGGSCTSCGIAAPSCASLSAPTTVCSRPRAATRWRGCGTCGQARSGHVLRGHTAFVRDVDFRRDGRVLVTAADDGDARTWRVSTGAPIHVLRGHFSAVQGARFSPDGRWIVTAGPRTAGLWDARTGEFFAPTGLADPFLRGPLRGPISSAVFTPDGLRIVTASGDGTVRTYLCTACGRIDQLLQIARARVAGSRRG